MFKMYDVVIAKKDLENVPKGATGTILEVYGNDDYEIEFMNAEGQTLNLLTVNAKDIEIFKEESL